MQTLRTVAGWLVAWVLLAAVLTALLIGLVAVLGRWDVQFQLFRWGLGPTLRWWYYPAAGALLAVLVFLWIAVAGVMHRERELRMTDRDFQKLRDAAIAAVRRYRPEGFREDVDLAMALKAATGLEKREQGPYREEWKATLFPFAGWLVTRRCKDKSGSEWSDTWTVRYTPHAIDPFDESTQKLERELAAMSQGMPRRAVPSQPEAEEADDEDALLDQGDIGLPPWRWDAPRPLQSVREVETEVQALIPDEHVQKGITVTAHKVTEPFEGYCVWLNSGNDRELVAGRALSISLVDWPHNAQELDDVRKGRRELLTLPEMVEAAAMELSRRGERAHRSRPERNGGRGPLP